MTEQLGSRIDVICPVYNRPAAIRMAIDSVLAQSVENWRLIVVSDGSTDGTDDVVRGYDDPRIQLIRAAHHGHPGGPRNIGLAAADAPFVAYLDSDDRWLPNHLAVLLNRLEGGARLVVTGSIGVDAAGTEVYRSDLYNSAWHPEVQLVWAMYEPSRVGHVRGLVEKHGGWSTDAAGMEDWDLWLRLADGGERFTTVAEHTVHMFIDPSTRRHTVAVEYRMVLGAVPDAPSAAAVRETIRSPEYQARLRRAFTEDMVGLYRELAGSGELVLPDGVTHDRFLHYLENDFLASAHMVMMGDLEYQEAHGQIVVVRPLRCSSTSHAQRLEQFFRRWDRRRITLVEEAITAQATTSMPAGR